jgi:uncharacterized protein YodC (DUF2158 family)
MNFKPGDIVMKITGGNKMRIISLDESEKKVDCVWFTERYHESSFNASEIVSINEWKSISKTEGRIECLKKLLEN